MSFHLFPIFASYFKSFSENLEVLLLLINMRLQRNLKRKTWGICDHARDMGLGRKLMDDDKRNKMLKEAKGLGDRFCSAGTSGGFL